MRVAVLGQGGREHAIGCSLLKSPLVSEVLVIPGNPGMELDQKIKVLALDLNHFSELQTHLKRHEVNLVIIGPENLLAQGLADSLSQEGFLVVGPGRDLAQLESSKAYAKAFMVRHEIPTADFYKANSAQEALRHLEHFPMSVVLKADELHAGKGVFVIDHLDQHSVKTETKSLIEKLFHESNFSIKTSQLVMEQKLSGKEVSVFALSDGDSYKILGYVCDHKRLLDDDLGPNTGGMGCYTVTSWPNRETRAFIEKQIIKRTFDALKEEGKSYRGFLFFGLMVDETNHQTPAKVIEYNVRMGDPETQTLLPLLDVDLIPYFLSLKDQSLARLPDIKRKRGEAVHIVLAAKGYPGVFGEEIEKGIPLVVPSLDPRAKVFYAGIKKEKNTLVSNGGRVLGLTVCAQDLKAARELAYSQVKLIDFKGAQFRHDIGAK